MMKAKDWIALVIAIGGLTLIGLGKDSVVGGLLIAVVAYYFGEKEVMRRK